MAGEDPDRFDSESSRSPAHCTEKQFSGSKRNCTPYKKQVNSAEFEKVNESVKSAQFFGMNEIMCRDMQQENVATVIHVETFMQNVETNMKGKMHIMAFNYHTVRNKTS